MIISNEIQSLVNLLLERNVSLYHACQLIDFESYLALGGIPSRALLKNRELPFTPFETDTTDIYQSYVYATNGVASERFVL